MCHMIETRTEYAMPSTSTSVDQACKTARFGRVMQHEVRLASMHEREDILPWNAYARMPITARLSNAHALAKAKMVPAAKLDSNSLTGETSWMGPIFR